MSSKFLSLMVFSFCRFPSVVGTYIALLFLYDNYIIILRTQPRTTRPPRAHVHRLIVQYSTCNRAQGRIQKCFLGGGVQNMYTVILLNLGPSITINSLLLSASIIL